MNRLIRKAAFALICAAASAAVGTAFAQDAMKGNATPGATKGDAMHDNAMKGSAPSKGSDAYQPRWSPDGQQIVFVQNYPGNSNLVIFDVATGAEHPLTQASGHKADEAPSWR